MFYILYLKDRVIISACSNLCCLQEMNKLQESSYVMESTVIEV